MKTLTMLMLLGAASLSTSTIVERVASDGSLIGAVVAGAIMGVQGVMGAAIPATAVTERNNDSTCWEAPDGQIHCTPPKNVKREASAEDSSTCWEASDGQIHCTPPKNVKREASKEDGTTCWKLSHGQVYCTGGGPCYHTSSGSRICGPLEKEKRKAVPAEPSLDHLQPPLAAVSAGESQCSKWFVMNGSDTRACEEALVIGKITLYQFRRMNPSVDEGCTNIEVRRPYCIDSPWIANLTRPFSNFTNVGQIAAITAPYGNSSAPTSEKFSYTSSNIPMLATKSTFASNGESSIPVTKALSSFETNSVSSSISKLNNTFSIHVTTPTTADFTPIGAGGRTPIDANSKLSLISRSKAADTITASTSTSSDFDVFNVFSEAHVDPNTQNHPSPAILKTLKETQAGPAPLIGQTSRDSLEFISVGSAISEASSSIVVSFRAFQALTVSTTAPRFMFLLDLLPKPHAMGIKPIMLEL
ncbi:MAG: hypothetical protein Q9190_003642 [Brigantiaea leucoxantha]